ncbi:hypothetical protein MRB53_006556 [Persea americana]|uniref:Uncharacterized protein n=1 Tax=Persea americana TaxID=3435 RepID=A0ACC2MH05_PERAE|nr:hypothetical protein MRB53_006556 [Persea americana]
MQIAFGFSVIPLERWVRPTSPSLIRIREPDEHGIPAILLFSSSSPIITVDDQERTVGNEGEWKEDQKRSRSSSPLRSSFANDGRRSFLLQIDLQQQLEDKKRFRSSSPLCFSFSDDGRKSLLFRFIFLGEDVSPVTATAERG